MKRALRFAAVAGIAAGGLLTGAGVGPAQAGPTHVAIVIAGVKTACVPWYSGMTGSDVLTAAAKVVWGNPGTPQAGMVLYIDGVGASTTSEHYWSYWESGTSGWAYSSLGPDSTAPEPGTVEGWHFISASGDPQPPPAASYSSICHDTTTAAPPPATSAPPPAPPATLSSSAPAPTPHASTTRQGLTPPSTTRATATSKAPSSSARPSASRSPSSTRTPRVTLKYGYPTSPPECPTSTVDCPSTSPSSKPKSDAKAGGSAAPVVGTAIGLTAAAAIGSLAYWRMRTQGGAE